MFSTNVAANEMGFPGKYFFLTNRFNQPNKIGISIAWFWYWFGMSQMVYGLGRPISTIFQSTVYSLNRYIVRYLYTYSIPEGKKWKTWSIVLNPFFLLLFSYKQMPNVNKWHYLSEVYQKRHDRSDFLHLNLNCFYEYIIHLHMEFLSLIFFKRYWYF